MMRIWRYVPGKRSKTWLFLFLPIAFIIAFLISGISIMSLKVSLGSMDILIVAAISLIGALSICGFGYAGLRIAFMSCLMGILAGIAFMTYVFNRPIQWAGIVGLVSGAQTVFLFFLVGVNLQMISAMVKRRRG